MMIDNNTLNPDELDLIKLIGKTLNIELDLANITSDTPVYQDGLGLDSIDILEIALAVSQHYGVKLRSDDTDNLKIFQNVGTLNAYIQAHKTAE